jgi:hypothetical protein
MIENSVFLMQAMHENAIGRMLGEHASAVAGHDRVQYGEPGLLTYLRGDRPLARYRYEVLATFDHETRVFRWGWAEKDAAFPKRVDAIYREGQNSQLTTLATEQLHDVWETDAERLVRLGAHLATARGLLRCDVGARTTWLALFDARGVRETMRPPRPLKEHAPIQTMPPAGLGGHPAAMPMRPVRTPAQRRLQQVVSALRDDLRASFMGFREALLTVRIDVRQDKARFVVQLAVADGDGRLQVLEPSMPLMEATARFIRADSDEGNGRWQRLVLRLSSDALGANVDEVTVD